AQKDDAFLEQLVVRVRLFDAPAGVLDERRQYVARLGRELRVHSASPLMYSARVMMWSTNPYSRASGAVNHRSRSESASMRSIDWPGNSAFSRNISFLMTVSCSAWIAMSAALPVTPPSGWCIQMRGWGSA